MTERSADGAAETSRLGDTAKVGRNVLRVAGERHPNDVFGAAVQMTRMAMALSDPNQPDNPIVFCNPAFLQQTGYAEHEVIGRNCRFLQGPGTDPATVARIRQAVHDQRDISEDIYNYRRNGQGFWNSLYICPIFDTDGKLLHFFASQVDITMSKEKALRQSHQLDAVGDMASGVAHAFNNLVTVVVASIDQAAKRPSDDRQRVQLARADKYARDAGRLTQQMLSFARRQYLEEEEVEVNDLIRNMDKLLSQAAGEAVDFALQLTAAALPARLDAGQLERSLVALVRNGADALPAGGRLVVATRVLSTWDVQEGQTEHVWVEVSVADQGDGMSSDVHRRAREPFFTTKDGNTGLGLSMVNGFVEQSRGRMSIDTEPGRGTTVRLLFPLQEAAPG